MYESDPRVDLMLPAGQRPEHVPGVGFIGRLAEDVIVQNNNGVGSKNQRLLVTLSDVERLIPRESLYLPGRFLALSDLLRSIAGIYYKGHSQPLQEEAPPR